MLCDEIAVENGIDKDYVNNKEGIESVIIIENNLLFDNISLLKYMNNNKKEMEYEILFDKDIEKLYNNIIKADKNILLLIEQLKNKININDISIDEPLFQYLDRIIDAGYIVSDVDYYDNNVISYFKDWYIDGESRDIELPYGVTLEYREPEFVKKDIKEIVYTNERELDHNSKEPQVYVMYYKDFKGKLNGTYTDVTFIKTRNDYIIDFNPYELLYDLKKPTVRLVVK